jgi:CRP-like cAMP-binding protein/Fe-S-cluster-containing hydrogenase component 2
MIAAAPADLSRLATVPLFRGIDEAVIRELMPFLSVYQFAAGEAILREGEYCDGAYYLIEGVVEVRFRATAEQAAAPAEPGSAVGRTIAWLRDRLRPVAAQPAGVPRATDTVVLPELPIDLRPGDRAVLEAGDIFGEGSALSRYPIATDVSAISAVKCLMIRTPALRAMFDLEEFAAFKTAFDLRYRQRTLRAHLRRVPLLQDVSDRLLDQIADEAELVGFKPNKVIAEQGAVSDAFYLVRAGYVKVGLRLGDKDLAVTYLRKGDFAGETALLLDDEPLPFSLTALEHVELVRISRDAMRAILSAQPEVERRMWTTMVGRLRRRKAAGDDPIATQYLQYAMDSGLIHGESVLLIDLERCTRCDDCVRACAEAHNGVPRFVREGSRFKNFSVPTACFQCTDPVCMIGCPTGAITRPLGTMEVAIDPQTCIGCGNCVKRCPWDNILTIPYDSPATGSRINLATKCDLCLGREDGPACVQMCPHGATVRVNFKDHTRTEGLLSR